MGQMLGDRERGLWRRVLAVLQMRRDISDAAADSSMLFDRAEAEQRQLLQKLRIGLVDVATSAEEIEREAARLRGSVPLLGERARRAVASGQIDLARVALTRKRAVLHELDILDAQLATIRQAERDLLTNHRRLSHRIEQLRTRRVVFVARQVAAETQIEVTEALTGLMGELSRLGFAIDRAERNTNRLQIRTRALASFVLDATPPIGASREDAFEGALRAAESSSSIDEELAAIAADQRDDAVTP